MLYFLRATIDPEADLIRNFSCVYNAWVDDKEDIEDAIEEYYPEGSEHLLPPRQDPNTGEWCWEPESGLSSFAFNNETSFNKALQRVKSYGKHLGQIAVFSSNNYDLKSGADGEDLFTNGVFIGWLSLDSSYENFLQMIYLGNKQDLDEIEQIKRLSGL